MPEIDVPLVGRVERKWVIAGGLTAVGIAAWWYLSGRSRKAAADAAAIDPLTGLPYSAEQGTGTGGYVNPNPVQSVIDGTGGRITTNAEWAAAVTEALGNLGIDPNYLAGVLGKYLGRQPLTLTEAATVRTAWAYKGKPPEGPDSFTLETGGGSTPGGGGGTTPPPPPPPPPSTAPPRRYVRVVKFTSKSPPWNSTLSGIAGRSGRSVSQLQQWNGIVNANLIYTGQKIWIDPPGTYSGETQWNG